jgi:hypothetical protein
MLEFVEGPKNDYAVDDKRLTDGENGGREGGWAVN